MFEPESTQELCVIALKNDTKFEEELTCSLKNDMWNVANFHSILQDWPQGYILSYFQKLHRALSVSRMLVEFSLKLLYSTICGQNFQIYGVHIPRKWIDSRHFYSCPSPVKTCPQILVIAPQAEGNYSFPQAVCFPQQQKGGEETMICFIKLQSENMKMT